MLGWDGILRGGVLVSRPKLRKSLKVRGVVFWWGEIKDILPELPSSMISIDK